MAENTIYTAAIIGLGRIGFSLGLDKKREQPASHTMALLENNRIKIIAGCDTSEDALSEWKKTVKDAQTFSSSDTMYKCCHPDIITIAVNESAHMEETIKAIQQHPKLVILEKPVALSVAQGMQIKEAAERENVPVLVNHERRFSDDYFLAKEFLSEIGSLQEIKASLYSGMAVYIPEEEETGAYSLLHDCTHLVDILLFFLEDSKSPSTLIEVPENEPPKEKKDGNDIFFKKTQEESGVKKITVNSLLKRPVISGVVRDEFGKTRQLTAAYSTHNCPSITVFISGRSKFFAFELEITGTEGRICIGNGYCKLYHAEESPLYESFYSLCNQEDVEIPKKTHFFANMIKNAVSFLDGKSELQSSLGTGLNALAILEEIKNKLK